MQLVIQIPAILYELSAQWIEQIGRPPVWSDLSSYFIYLVQRDSTRDIPHKEGESVSDEQAQHEMTTIIARTGFGHMKMREHDFKARLRALSLLPPIPVSVELPKTLNAHGDLRILQLGCSDWSDYIVFLVRNDLERAWAYREVYWRDKKA